MMTPILLNNRYKVIRLLGSGGFGETSLAEDTQMPSRRWCVIKQLKPVTNNPQIYQLVQERFGREAAILEELGDGSNQIPRLYAYFCEGGQFYLVQEWIQGQTLSNKLQHEGILSESSVKEILLSILPVLEYVHSKRIVHRDIKPDNIILRDSDGKPVLIDFGAVKETMGTVVTPSGNSSKSIVIGTPGFMPSEQSAGRPMYSSDLYSLGLTAIYLLTGKIPQQLDADPRTGEIMWRQYALSVSPSFAAVLDRAINSHARDRYATAREMLDALNSGVFPIPPTVPTPQPTEVNVASPQPLQTEKTPSSGLGDWQKAAITGSVIGGFVILGLILTRPQTAPSTQPYPAPTTAQQPPSPQPTAEPEPPVVTPLPTPQVVQPPVATTLAPTPVVSPVTPPSQSTFADNPVPPPQPEPTVTPITSNPPVSVKSREQQLDDLADKLFSERYPELRGRKIQPGEMALAREWRQIRQCDAIVDFIFHERHPELGGRKIIKGETDLTQEWNQIKRTVSGCN